jgi:hypothetical protein
MKKMMVASLLIIAALGISSVISNEIHPEYVQIQPNSEIHPDY